MSSSLKDLSHTPQFAKDYSIYQSKILSHDLVFQEDSCNAG